MVIIIVQDALPGFPHTPFLPVDERFPLFDRLRGRHVGLPLSFTTKLSSPSVMRMWKNMENDKESAKK